MADLEKAVAENMKQLDKLEEYVFDWISIFVLFIIYNYISNGITINRELLGETRREKEEKSVAHIPIEIRNR